MFMGGGRGGPQMMFMQETSKPQNVGVTLSRFWEFFKHYKLPLFGVIMLILISTYLQVLTPDLIGQAVDCFITPATQQALGSTAPTGGLGRGAQTNCWFAQLGPNATRVDYVAGLGGLVLLLVLLQVVGSALSGLQFYLMNYAGQSALRLIRIEVFRHIHRLSLGYFTKHEAGDVMSRITNDADTIQQTPGFPLVGVAQGALLIVWIAVNMLGKSWGYALISLAVALLASLTLAPALAGELERVPVATLIPHVHPTNAPGSPPYALGARMPRTSTGRALWRSLERPVQAGLRQGRAELNYTRAKLGLAPVSRLYGGISERLCLVGTFPQLEYPRSWPEEVQIIGPLLWEPPYHDTEPPPGEDPLVLVAVSTAQDPEHELLRAALRGLAREPVRVLAATNRKPLAQPVRVPANGKLVEWISYSRTMPGCAAVISHAGHGTLMRSLASGTPVLAVPHSGDMGENAARADWAGVGVRLPWRLLSPGTLRLALRRLLESPQVAARASSLADWAAEHDGATRAAELVEQLALRGG